MHFHSWLLAAKKLAPDSQSGRAILNVFSASLKWVCVNDHRGGCHDTSAAIYVLFSELGLTPVLCIGEVKYNQYFFDHSWVELSDKIFDVAICMPNTTGTGIPCSPIFASIDLTTCKKTELIYGAASPTGYDEEAKNVSAVTIGEYSQRNLDDPNIVWNLAKLFGKDAGMKVNIAKVRQKYSQIHRLEKHDLSLNKTY